MKFSATTEEEPKIDLVPFIDVLLVILIFLMLTTTYSRYTELELTLPVASEDASEPDEPRQVTVTVSRDGRYAVDAHALQSHSAEAVSDALRSAGATPETRLIISADAASAHQSVVTVMDAARRVGLTQITFLAQTGSL
ncbi:MAG: biopolymer transporter ExbD [Ottowia sp.]|nr:biopolymer transporter ExbD [Ottowia sp.]